MRTFSSRYELYLEIALNINNSLFNDKKIDYLTYKLAQDKLLQKLKQITKG